jgi:phosphopantetheinyl transferase (holo-ACP synthase)
LISTGNDIIALERTNAERTKQEKFYSKILCKHELELFKNINSIILSFENFVWLAWSVKESVYKFYQRTNQRTLFSPTKIIIQKIKVPLQWEILAFDNAQLEKDSFNNEACFCCEVQFASDIFYTRTLVFGDMIFSVANNTNCFENICWGIKNIDNDSYEAQSKNVRTFVLNKLNQFFLNDSLSIEKTAAGYPVLKQQKDIPLSFAHHGSFIAYSFYLKSKNPSA